MEKSFHLKIVTPNRLEFEGEVTSVTCPGTEGKFQVLYNHAPLLSGLDVGIMEFKGTENQVYAVSGGFTQVLHNSVLVLADTAERADAIDTDRAKAAKERAEERLSHRTKELDVERAELSLHKALNRLKAAGRN
ncbi:MAG: ATP synthase F1 subunit epsilon [Ectothiorhodospiraceae bacterium]|nr:ATP synthase F1 subunit epsilon [Ectothiorhodospiraceae bacterium]